VTLESLIAASTITRLKLGTLLETNPQLSSKLVSILEALNMRGKLTNPGGANWGLRTTHSTQLL
jgi:hypothetical protein